MTSIGRYLRKLRINRGEILKTMADNLNVSSAFLSAVENGKKKFPQSWIEKMKEIYNLSDVEILEMKEAIIESNEILEINLKNISFENRKLAISFARKFESLDAETSKKIQNILNNKKGG